MVKYRLVGVHNPSFDADGKVKYANKLVINTFYLPERDCAGDLEDLVLLPNAAYAEIFGRKRSEDSRHRKRLAIVRITFDGVSIHRAYRGMNVGKNNAGLTQSSIRYFGSDNNRIIGQSATLSRGSWFRYYWDHPFHATRISCRLGVLSLCLGIVSLGIGIAALFL